jgi:hypothetical protein
LTGAFVVLTAAAGAAQSREHVVSPDQLVETMTTRLAEQSDKRAVIHQTLQQKDVRDVASTIGADIDQLDRAIDTFADSDLERVADAARRVNDQLAGGGSVTISTTTIIIALLILILLIVALR